MSCRIAFLIVLLVLPVAYGQSEKPFDWPQWRGPDRNGVSQEQGLLKSWPKNGPPIIWKVTDLGGGYSCPSVAQGKVFGMSYRDRDEVIWALDETTGKEKWTTRIGKRGNVAYNDGPRSTPTVHGEYLYAVGVGGDLVCLSTHSGSIIWRRSFVKEFHGKMMSNWGFSESPLVDGDLVIGTPGADDAAIVAFDKKTGKTVWMSPIEGAGGAGYSSIMPITVNGLKMYVTWLGKQKDLEGKMICGKGLVGVSAATGKCLWNYCRIANSTANIPTVLVRDQFIFTSNGYPEGGTAVLKVSVEGKKVHIEEVAYHSAKDLQNHHGGMVRVGECVYLGRGQKNGLPTCIDFLSAKIIWQADRGAGRGSAGIIAADGMIYFRYEDGTMAMIEATPKGYHLISKFSLPEQSGKPGWSHPVIANSKLFIRDQDSLVCFDLKAK
jgi:outer membrane protein assembly factor BamB